MFKGLMEYIKAKQAKKASEQLRTINERINEIDQEINKNNENIEKCNKLIEICNKVSNTLKQYNNVVTYLNETEKYNKIKEKYEYANSEDLNVALQVTTGVYLYDKRGSYEEIEKLASELKEQSTKIDKIKEISIVKQYVDAVNDFNNASSKKYFAKRSNARLSQEKDTLLQKRNHYERVFHKNTNNDKVK